MKGLYVHIPFCHAICTYCDFAKEIASGEKQTRYINALVKEIYFKEEALTNITTIYIGGGTPSALALDDLENVLETLHEVLDMSIIEEFTIECNPNDVNLGFASLLQRYGINRISLGVQTCHPKHLRFLNRTHTKQDIENAFRILKDADITNISVDMMFALPNQTMHQLKKDIKEIIALEPKHISYYSLILEEKTPLHYLVEAGKVNMPDNSLEAEMYEYVIDTLIDAGYHHYEISNFAKQGYESKHNSIYWKNEDYIGVGASSHSKIDDKRYMNYRSVKHYIDAVEKTHTGLESHYPYEGIRDYMLMGLRRLEGIHIPTVEKTFDITLFETYPELKEAIDKELLTVYNDYLKLTRKGLLFGNDVFLIF